MSTTLLLLLIFTVVLQIVIVFYGYKVFKIASYLSLWRRGWVYFIITAVATLIRRLLEVVGINGMWHAVLSVISTIFILMFTYNIARVFQAVTKLNRDSTFTTLLKNLPTGVIIYAEDTSILYANEMAKEILRIQGQDVEGLFDVDLNNQLHFLQENGDPLPIENYPVNVALATNEPFNHKIYGINHTKSTIWVLVNAYLTTNGEKQIVVVFTDITPLKEAEDACKLSEEKYKQAFMSSHDAIIISRLDDGKINSINKSFTFLSGWEAEELAGKTVFDINIWRNSEDRMILIRELKEKGLVKDFDAHFNHKDGSDIHGLLSASTFMLEGERYLLSSVKLICQRDHNERKED